MAMAKRAITRQRMDKRNEEIKQDLDINLISIHMGRAI